MFNREFTINTPQTSHVVILWKSVTKNNKSEITILQLDRKYRTTHSPSSHLPKLLGKPSCNVRKPTIEKKSVKKWDFF